MKKMLLNVAAVMLLTLFINSANAQYFCFWVANNSNETFYTLKIRPSGGGSFSNDLLPENMIESGKHFWVKTGSDANPIYDVEITNVDGTPLNFAWTGTDGNYYERPYITLDVQALHTLSIISNDDGSLGFEVWNEDQYGYGHPCDN